MADEIPLNNLYIKVNGVWKRLFDGTSTSKVYMKINGVWKVVA